MKVSTCETFGEVSSGRASSGTLDQFFQHWRAMADRRVGVPQWLQESEIDATKRESRDTWGVTFSPDAVARTSEGAAFVIELKYGSKFEPIALAEALHHAYELRESPDRFPGGKSTASPPFAAIISQWNAWHRSAVDALRDRDVGPDALRYIEVVALTIEGFDAPVLWFEEYLTRGALKPWENELPVAACADDRGPNMLWYGRTDGSGVVVASEAALVDGCLPRGVQRRTFAPLSSGGWLVCKGSEVAGGTTQYSYDPP